MYKRRPVPRNEFIPLADMQEGNYRIAPPGCRLGTGYDQGYVNIRGELEKSHPEVSVAISILDKARVLSEADFSSVQDISLKRNLYYVQESLLWYERHITTRKGAGKGILYQNLLRKHEFADELDDLIKYSMRLSSSNCFWYGTDNWPPNTQEIKTLDDFYSPYHLLPFQRPDSGDIELVTQKPVEIPTHLLDHFREKVMQLVTGSQDRPWEPDDVARLSLLNPATTFVPSKNMRESKISRVSATENLETTSEFKFEHVEVYKEAHESRSCVVPDLPTLVTLQILEKRMEQVISCKSDVIRKKDFSYLFEYLSGCSRWCFLMSDQKKSGLTFPRHMIMEFYKTLHNLFPLWGFNLIEGWSNATIRINGKDVPFTNGVGLGMMNATVSIIVAILFEIWVENQDPEFRLNGQFYNDDQVIRVWTGDRSKVMIYDDSLADLGRSWDNHLESYGLIIHKKKPFLSRAGILLEQYGDDFSINSDKRVQKVCNLFKSLKATDIAAAKECFHSSAQALPSEMSHYIPEILSIVTAYWGSEFSKTGFPELALPYDLGGWLSSTENGFNTLFYDMTSNHTDWMDVAGFLEVSSPRNHILKQGLVGPARAIHENFKKFPGKIPSDHYDYGTLVCRAIEARRLKGPELKSLRVRLLRNRLRAFNTPIAHPRDVIKYYFERLETGGNYLPPVSLRSVGTNYRFHTGQEVPPGFKPEDPLRLMVLISQYHSLCPAEVKIQLRKESPDYMSVIYNLALSASLAFGGTSVTPLQISKYLLGGAEYWDRIYCTQVSRGYPIQDPLLEHPVTAFIGRLFGADDPCEILSWDHELGIAWTTGLLEDPGWLLQEGPAQELSLRAFNRNLQWTKVIDGETFPIELESWAYLRLADPRVLYEREKDPTSRFEPENPEELRTTGGLTATQLLAELLVVASHISEEVRMRDAGLSATILGGDDPDIFGEDDFALFPDDNGAWG